MASVWENHVWVNSMTADGAVNEKRFVKASGAQQDAQGQVCVGVSLDTVADGKEFRCCSVGDVVVEAGGTFSAGERVQSDANGKAIKATANCYVCGIAMTAGTASSDATIRLGACGGTLTSSGTA